MDSRGRAATSCCRASGSRFLRAVVQLVHPCIGTAMPINRFRGEFYFLSNFFPCRQGVEFEGDLYPTSEHAYQAKIKDWDGRDSFTRGGSLGDKPMDAKLKGGKIEERPDWDNLKVAVMLAVVRSKFARDEALRKKLRATRGQKLVEGHTSGVERVIILATSS